MVSQADVIFLRLVYLGRNNDTILQWISGGLAAASWLDAGSVSLCFQMEITAQTRGG